MIATTRDADKIWAVPSVQNRLVEFWASSATRLRGQRVFVAFDLVNESVPTGFTCGRRKYRCFDRAARMVEAVQKAFPTQLCMVESEPNLIRQSFDNLRPLPYSGFVYSFNSHMAMSFTHHGVMLAAAITFTQRYESPFYLDEFSAPRRAPAQSAVASIAAVIAQSKRYGWSWAYHGFQA